MLKLLRYLFPFFDPDVLDWAFEARLLRWLTFLWMFVGLVVLFSASYPFADAKFGDGLYYFKRQIIWLSFGLVSFSLLVHRPVRFILKAAQPILLIFVGLIILTLVPGVGTTVNGATRWLSIGPVPLLQPSELIKPFLVLQSANIFGNWRQIKWKTRFLWLFIFVLTIASILIQPNLSTAALCGMALWLIALTAGLPWVQMGSTALSGIVLGLISIGSQEYQRRRIISFLNPWADPSNTGYQLVQSLLAVGSGRVWGTGYGLSQQKLFYLPIQYTDFIFAVFAEEFGLVGGVLLLLMLMIYATVALIVAWKARQPTHQLIAVGATLFLVGQSLINIGVAIGTLPTTGLPLPLFSYGGSSVLASLMLAGLLVRVARESNEAEVVPLHGRRHSLKEMSGKQIVRE